MQSSEEDEAHGGNVEVPLVNAHQQHFRRSPEQQQRRLRDCDDDDDDDDDDDECTAHCCREWMCDNLCVLLVIAFCLVLGIFFAGVLRNAFHDRRKHGTTHSSGLGRGRGHAGYHDPFSCGDCGLGNKNTDPNSTEPFLTLPTLGAPVAPERMFPLYVLGTVKQVPWDNVQAVMTMIKDGMGSKWESQVFFVWFGESEDWPEDGCAPPGCTWLRGDESRDGVRPVRIAHGRNKLMDFAADRGAASTMVIDPDIVFKAQNMDDPLRALEVAHQWFNNERAGQRFRGVTWAGVVGGNSHPTVSADRPIFATYYDYWALRHSRWTCDLWTCHWKGPGDKWKLFFDTLPKVFEREMLGASGGQPMRAESAFNGIAIYKGAPNDCRYVGWDSHANAHICEHVKFHECLGGVVIETRYPLITTCTTVSVCAPVTCALTDEYHKPDPVPNATIPPPPLCGG